MAYALYDLRVRQRRNVSNIGEVAASRKNSAHDLARTRLGHILDDPDILRPRNLPNLGINRPGHFLLNVPTWTEPRLQSNIHLNNPATQIIYQRHSSSLGYLFDDKARR